MGFKSTWQQGRQGHPSWFFLPNRGTAAPPRQCSQPAAIPLAFAIRNVEKEMRIQLLCCVLGTLQRQAALYETSSGLFSWWLLSACPAHKPTTTSVTFLLPVKPHCLLGCAQCPHTVQSGLGRDRTSTSQVCCLQELLCHRSGEAERMMPLNCSSQSFLPPTTHLPKYKMVSGLMAPSRWT